MSLSYLFYDAPKCPVSKKGFFEMTFTIVSGSQNRKYKTLSLGIDFNVWICEIIYCVLRGFVIGDSRARQYFLVMRNGDIQTWLNRRSL